MSRRSYNSIRAMVDEAGREQFSRSGGPGGQNVNKVSTQVTLTVPLAELPLTEAEWTLLQERLGARISAEGALVMRSSEHRTQIQNREAAKERAAMLIAEALTPRRRRRATRPTRASRERRLSSKRARAQKKRLRKKPDQGDQ